MMSGVIECIKGKMNGLIESPTGTGKTLSVICGAIAAMQSLRKNYRRYRKFKKKEGIEVKEDINEEDEETRELEEEISMVPTTIIYCTRTHS